MKYIKLLLPFILAFLFIQCSSSKPEEETTTTTTTTTQVSTESKSNIIIFRDDSNQILKSTLKDNKVDLVSTSVCPKVFNGCCLSNGVSSYHNGIYSEFYNTAKSLGRDLYCELWLHYKSDEGQVLAFPVEYQNNRNMLKVNGVYFECVQDENHFWVPNFNYFHTGWPSETFDYVMDFAPSKFIRFKQQFCKTLGIPDSRSKSGKIFPLEISENPDLKIYSELPFDDLVVEYKDITAGIDNFVDYYYFDRLDYLRDRIANVTFLIRDNETLYPVEDAIVTITPLEPTGESKEVFERFTDFTLRAPNFDYGFYGFKSCADEKVLDKFSMQTKLFNYFTEYKLNPWAVLSDEFKAKTDKNGEIYWTTNYLYEQNVDLYNELIKTPLFKKEIANKAHYFVMERNKNYQIKIIHPRYQYFERTFSISGDSQVIVDLAQVTTKLENVGGRGNKENIYIRPLVK
ncbi:MAG: hypothetical protein NUV92_05620 [Ignavibacteria bacterium]|jgi:hypothetical protein|nr:hypothetical protein [Ignavibacteria bacterium]MDH7527503.1 hypothetical protein [Ignavibacteria bacterium]